MPDYIDAKFRDTRPLWRRLRPVRPFAHKPDIMAKTYNGDLYVPPKPFWWTKRTWKEWTALVIFGIPVAVGGIMWLVLIAQTFAASAHH